VRVSLKDLYSATRTLLQAPIFSGTVVLLMVLGIGSTVAMFTTVRSVLMKPLPFRDPAGLISLYERDPHGSTPYSLVAGGVFDEWRRSSKNFEDMAIYYRFDSHDIASPGQLADNITSATCSWNLFSIMGVQPILGRTFNSNDDRRAADATVILSWGLWKRRFNGDPSILGKYLFLDSRPYTIIGVMPAFLQFPDATTALWTPLYHERPPKLMQALDNQQFSVLARLKKGTSRTLAVEELDVIQKAVRQQSSNPNVAQDVVGRTLIEDMTKDYETPLYVLLAATGCVLLIACINIGNLMVARSATKRREIAIRAVLGANRWQQLRGRVFESLLLSTASGIAALGFAAGAISFLKHVRSDMPRMADVKLDGFALMFVFAVSISSAVAAVLVSACGVEDAHAVDVLKESALLQTGGRPRQRIMLILLVAEVGLTVILLTVAGLLLKSYQRLSTNNMGCAPDNVLTLQLSLPPGHYANPTKKVQFFLGLLQQVRTLPGVSSATAITAVPGQGDWQNGPVAVPGKPSTLKGQASTALYRATDSQYFRTMQIPLLSGRTFSDNDRLETATKAILSKMAANRFYPGDNPIGRHITVGEGADQKTLEVVGVVGDTRYDISQDVQPMVYWPLLDGQSDHVTLAVRTLPDSLDVALSVQKLVNGLDPSVPLSNIETMREMLGNSLVAANLNATLVLLFALIALFLAATGLFGVFSYVVALRTSEFGIRMALGAQRRDLLRLVLVDGMRPVWIGLFIGVLGSAFAGQLIREMLFGVSSLDWSVFCGAAVILLVVASLACALPAFNASRLDPLKALRS
jgi:predicted permease